jgi:hypothetical protein
MSHRPVYHDVIMFIQFLDDVLGMFNSFYPILNY